MKMNKLTQQLKNLLSWGKTNWVMLLLSLVFAIMLWNLIITDANPLRTTLKKDLTIAIEGQTLLTDRGLTISSTDDLAEDVKGADATLEMTYSEYVAGRSADVRLWIDLSNITAEGEYTLPVHGQSDKGVVAEISPQYVKVNVEKYETRVVAVECVVHGELPEGYWREATPTLSSTTVQIRGAQSVLDQISKAVVDLDIDGATEKISTSGDIRLVNKENKEVDLQDIRLGTPNCIITLDVKPTKKVPVVVADALLGTLKDGYEVTNYQITPDYALLAGRQEELDAIDSVTISPMEILEGAATTRSINADLLIPSTVTCLTSRMTNIIVFIAEKTTTVRFSSLPVAVSNVPEGYEVVSSGAMTADAEIRCTQLRESYVTEGRVKLFVDAENLGEGSHTLFIQSEIEKADGVKEVRVTPKSITIELIPKE